LSGKTLQEFLANNLGKLLGVLIGLLLGWMIIEYGVFQTLFVIILVDEGDSLSAFVDRIFKR